MKVGFFLLKFPLSSETFVLNQITAFIDMGFEVEIVALQKGDTTKHPRGMDEIQPCCQNPLVTGRTCGQSGETAPPRQPDLTRHSS